MGRVLGNCSRRRRVGRKVQWNLLLETRIIVQHLLVRLIQDFLLLLGMILSQLLRVV